MLMHQHREHSFSLWQLCTAAHLDYRTFMRWKGRCAQGRPAVEPPGPGPAGPLDLDAVWERVRQLHHVRQRTHGTGALYRELRGALSRRQLRELVQRARRDQRREAAAAQWRLEWTASFGKVWATDTKEIALADGHRVWFQTIRDLGARYTIGPFATHHPSGRDIARWLKEAFEKYGAPLFLRLDNAGNENCPEVRAVLAEYHVIPYNSPPQYPLYNGGVERAQRELEAEAEDWTAVLPAVPAEHLSAYAAVTVNGLNHKPRPVLGGRHACQVFTRDAGHAILTTTGQRQEVLNELIGAAAVLLDEDDSRHSHRAARAWRHAVQWWLETHAVIRVIQAPSVNQLPAQSCDKIGVA